MGALYSSTYGTTPENEATPTQLQSTDGLHSAEKGNPKPPHKEDVELSKQNHCSESSVDSGFASVSSASVTDFDEEEDEGEELQTGHLFKDAFDILQSDAGFLRSSPSGTLINENYILRAPVEELLLNTTPIENKQHAASIEELYSFPMPFPTNQESGWKDGGKLQPSNVASVLDGGDGICSVIEEEEEEEDQASKISVADGDKDEQYDFHLEDELDAEEGVEELPGENSLAYHYTHEIYHESIKVTYSDGVVRETLEQISIEENCDTDSEYSDLNSEYDHIEDGGEDYEYEEDQNLSEYEEDQILGEYEDDQNLSEYEEDQNLRDDASDEYSDSDAEEQLTNSSLTSVTDLLDSFEQEEDSGFLIPAQITRSDHEESMQPLNRESVSEHMDEDRGLRIEDFEICRDDADVETDVSLIKKGEYNTWIHFSPHHSDEEGEDMEDHDRTGSPCQAVDIMDQNRSDSLYDPYQADHDDHVDFTDPEEDLIFDDDPKPDFEDWIRLEWNKDNMASMCEEHGCLHEDDTNSSEEGTGFQNLTIISSLQGVMDIEADSFAVGNTTRNDLINEEGDIEDVNPQVELSVEHDLLVIDDSNLEHGSMAVTDDHGQKDDYYRLCYGPDIQVESQQDHSPIVALGINPNEDNEFLKHNSGFNDVMEEVFHDMVIHVDNEFQDEDCSSNQGDMVLFDDPIRNEHEEHDLTIDSYSSVHEQILSYHKDHSSTEGALEKDGVIHEECTYVDKTIHDKGHSTKDNHVNVMDFNYMPRSTERENSSNVPKEEDEYATSSVIETSAAMLNDGAGDTPNQEYIDHPCVEDDQILDLGTQKLESIEEVEGSPGPIDHAFDEATSQVHHDLDDATSQRDHKIDDSTSQTDHDCDESNIGRDHEFDESISQGDYECDESISQIDLEFDESISQKDHEFDESISQKDHEFDESIGQKDHEFDGSISQRDHEFDESASQRDHEFDESINQRDHEFDESIGQKDHEFNGSISQSDHEFDESISQRDHEFDESISQRDHEFDESISQRDHEFDESVSQRDHELDESVSQRDHEFDESISQRDHEFDESFSQIDLDIGYSTCQVDLELDVSTSQTSQTDHGFDDSTSQVHLEIDNITSEIAHGFDDSSIHTSQADNYSTSQMDHGFEDSTSLELDNTTSQTGQADLEFDYSISQLDYEYDYPTSQMDNESDDFTIQKVHELDGVSTQIGSEVDDCASQIDCELYDSTNQIDHELADKTSQIDHELAGITSQIDHELADTTSQIDHELAGTTSRIDHELDSSSPEDHGLHNLTSQAKNELKDSTHIHHELHDSETLIDSGLDTTYYSEDEDDFAMSWGSGQWGRSTYNTAITNLTVSDLSYKDISQIATMLHEGCTYNYWYTVGTGLLYMYGQHIAITKYELEDLYRLYNGDRTKAMNFLEAMKSCEPKYKLHDFRMVAIRLKRMDVYLAMEEWDEQLLSNLPHEKQIHLANLLDQKNSGSTWQDFARLIGFSRNEIKHMHEFVTAPHMELMLRLRSKGGNLTLGCLCAIFDDLSRPDIIELIERLIRRNDRIR